MAKIQIYARLRPTQNPYEGLQTSCSNDRDDTVTINTESTNDQLNSMYSKSPGSKLNFRFNCVFGMRSTQDEIFDTVAREMIDTFLDGYNGTVFAYGQTSSGKTYTIEGSGRKFVDRGLIPRTLSYIYKEIEKRSVERDVEMSVHISYMEIYQDTGYDLLNPGMRPGALMVEVPKVQVAEGPGGEIRVRDLSLHLAATEEVAQSLLFQGSTCRKVAETSMNQCSSRSHTIFSIVLTAKTGNSEVITRSKLNLVDLAGSERVAKTGADGRVLREAKHINLSLHHLEHVIVTLQQYLRQARAQGLSTPPTARLGTGISEKTSQDSVSSGSTARYNTSRGSLNSSRAGLSSRHSSSPDNGTIRSVSRPWTRRGHVPYRNCMLTMVLKDSLGGNCLTAMIATISADESNIHETIATCRFSQRVACISNRARRNEELDDKVVIRKLRQRVAELEAEIQSLKDHTYLSPTLHPPSSPTTGWSNSFDRPLTDNDRQRCHQILYGFFHGKIENPVGAGIDSAAMFQESLLVLRTIVLQSLGINKDTANQSDESSRHTVEQIRHAAYSESPSAQSTSPPAEKGTQSATGEPRLINVAPRDKKSKAFATPSPHSRLSSGFGSLHDEDGSVNYEVSSDQVGQSNQVGHGNGVVEQTSLRDSHSQSFDVENGLREHGHKRRHRRHKRHRHTRSGEAPLADVGVKNHTHTNRERRAKHTHEETELNSSIIPPPPIGAWTSPDTSASNRKSGERDPSIQSMGHSNDWSLQSTPPAHIATAVDNGGSMLGTEQSVVSPQEMKVLSPRAERKRKKLQSKQVELMRSREEKKRLASEVNLLNLKVEEEGTKDELSHIGELLATQHVQYTQLNKGGASPEKLCAEKIAEQQLRIKQAKLHQKLLDIQYQLRMSGDGIMDSSGAVSTNRDMHPISPKYSSPAPVSSYAEPTTSPSPGNAPLVVRKMPTPQIENEILQHDLRQSKVQQQIEKLRISQMEKQLELKEASTRRKILALKQQLQGGSKPPSTAPAKPSTHTAALPSKRSIPSSKSDQLLATIQPQLGTYHEKGSHWSESSSMQTNIVHSTIMPTHRSSRDTSDKLSNKLTKQVTSRSDTTESRTASELEINSDSVSTPNNRSDPAIASTEKSQASGSANGNPSTPQSRAARQKLTLPEEIKETEYMSAVQRQKARVSRIRRCIVAATVIQRAWRDYKIAQK